MSDPRLEEVPIPHDGYLKLFCRERAQLTYNVILLVEAQDINPCVLDLLQRQNARVCMIGDPFQSIYLWWSAVDAMRLPVDKILRLTGSFCFGPEIAAVGDHVLKWIHDGAPTLRDLGRPRRVGGIASGYQVDVLGQTNEDLFNAAAQLLLSGR